MENANNNVVEPVLGTGLQILIFWVGLSSVSRSHSGCHMSRIVVLGPSSVVGVQNGKCQRMRPRHMSLTFVIHQSNYPSERPRGQSYVSMNELRRQILVYITYHRVPVCPLDPYMDHTRIAETIPTITQNAVSEDLLQ